MDKKIKIIAQCDDVNGAEVNIEAHGVGAYELMAHVTMTMVALLESLTKEYGEAATMATAATTMKAVSERHGRDVVNVVVTKRPDDEAGKVLVYDKIENRGTAAAMKACAVYELMKQIEAETGVTRRELLEMFKQGETDAEEDPSERIMKEAAGHDGDHDA